MQVLKNAMTANNFL